MSAQGITAAAGLSAPVVSDVRRKTLRGAVQALGVTAVTAPAGFAVLLLLARVSTHVLGLYALVTLLVGLFGGLLTFGGPAVATRAATQAGSPFTSVIALQAIVAPLIAACVGGAAGMLPPLDVALGPYACAVLAAAVAVWTAAQGFTTASLKYGETSVIQNVPTIFQLVVFAALVGLKPDWLTSHSRAAVVGAYVVPMAGLGLVISARALRTTLRTSSVPVFLTSARAFGGLMLGVEGVVALTFVFEAGERFAALASPRALSTLAQYFAGVQIAYLVRRIPAIVGQASLAGFTALRGTPDAWRLRDQVARYLRGSAFMIASGLALFSRSLVGALGGHYQGTAVVIGVVAVSCAATSTWPVDTSLAIAEDRLHLYHVALLIGIVAFAPLGLSQSLPFLAVCRGVALLLAYVVVLSGLRGWARARADLVASAILVAAGGANLAVAYLLTPADCAVIWLVECVVAVGHFRYHRLRNERTTGVAR